MHEKHEKTKKTRKIRGSDNKNALEGEQEAALREQISAELEEQLLLERFQREHPDLWMQAHRLAKLMETQEGCEGQSFPPGSCFLYANLPGFQCFAVQRVRSVDVDTCQVSMDIYGDGDLQEGTVVLPLESIAWYGFPKDAIPLDLPYSGFTTTRPLGDGGSFSPRPVGEM